MRRRNAAYEAVPAQLMRLIVDEWAGSFEEAFPAWKQARRAYVAEHGDRTALGDGIDLLTVERQTRRAFTLSDSPM